MDGHHVHVTMVVSGIAIANFAIVARRCSRYRCVAAAGIICPGITALMPDVGSVQTKVGHVWQSAPEELNSSMFRGHRMGQNLRSVLC